MAQALGRQWDVISEGHPGRTTVHDDPIEGAHKNASRALHALLESHRPLDLVLVMLGTNDLKARFAIPASEIALGVQRLVLEISASDCGPDGKAPEILIVAPVSVLETGSFTDIFSGAQEKSLALPGALRAVAEQLGVGFADANDVAVCDPVDGIHLDADAHAALGAHLAKAVTLLDV